jgi:hypothetical protein
VVVKHMQKSSALLGCLSLALASTACEAKQTAPAAKQAVAQTLTCPAVYTAATRLPANAIVVGPKRTTATPLVYAGLVFGTAAAAKTRNVSEEMIDEWDELPSGISVAKWTYERNQTNLMMHCTYGTNRAKIQFTETENTVLFLPIADRHLVSCTFKQRGSVSAGATCNSKK